MLQTTDNENQFVVDILANLTQREFQSSGMDAFPKIFLGEIPRHSNSKSYAEKFLDIYDYLYWRVRTVIYLLSI